MSILPTALLFTMMTASALLPSQVPRLGRGGVSLATVGKARAVGVMGLLGAAIEASPFRGFIWGLL